jgi:hypothetical protein
MMVTASSMANYTRLIESLTLMQRAQIRDFDDISEESKEEYANY